MHAYILKFIVFIFLNLSIELVWEIQNWMELKTLQACLYLKQNNVVTTFLYLLILIY